MFIFSARDGFEKLVFMMLIAFGSARKRKSKSFGVTKMKVKSLSIFGAGILLSILLGSVAQAFIEPNPSYSVSYESNNTTLSYPSIFNGYMWVTTSRTDNSLRKYDLATDTLINQVNLARLDHSTDEAFNAYVYGGLVYVPSIGYQTTNTVLTIYDENTLDEVFHLDMIKSYMSGFTQTIYDPLHDRILFACDTQNGLYGFWEVDPAQSTVTSAYHFVTIATADGGLGGCEIQPVIFNDKVYAIMMNNGGGANGIVITRIYSSSDLVTWTLEYVTQGVNQGWGAYFPHISANRNYIVAGLISNANTGITTYRYVYKSTSEQWQEYDTGQLETSSEDQPMVEAIDDTSMFFLEVCDRFGSLNPSCYLFDASIGVAQYLYTIPNSGYNDRWFAIDEDTNTIYFQNGNRDGADYATQIIKSTFSFQLKDPLQSTRSVIYLTFTPNPSVPSQLVELYGNLKEFGGAPISSASVDIEYSLDNGVTWNFGSILGTNSTGEFSLTFTAPSVGEYLVRASYDGNATYKPSNHTETLTVSTIIPTEVSLTLSPNPVTIGQTVTLKGNLTDVADNPIGGAPLELWLKIGANPMQYVAALSTNSTGWYQASGVVTSVGTYEVAVVYRGSSQYYLSYKIETLTVNPPT